MKKLKCVALNQIFLVFLFASTANAEDYFTEITAMHSAVKVINCSNPAAIGTLIESALNDSKQNITTTPNEDSVLFNRLGCVQADKPSKYLIKETEPLTINKKRYGVSEVINTKTGEHRFIKRSDLMAYFEVDTSCHTDDMGGQVNRMEADKDGRLYLRKYMVTSKCVNGKNTAVWKALN